MRILNAHEEDGHRRTLPIETDLGTRGQIDDESRANYLETDTSIADEVVDFIRKQLDVDEFTQDQSDQTYKVPRVAKFFWQGERQKALFVPKPHPIQKFVISLFFLVKNCL